MLRRAASLEAFLVDPIGAWSAGESSLTWCVSPERAGALAWGAPDVARTRAILRAFDALWAPAMSARVDVILDGTRIERVDPAGIEEVVAWNVRRRAELRVVRQQIGVVGEGLIGVALAGILPVVGETHPFRVVRNAREAHDLLDPIEGAALSSELDRLVEEVRGVPAEVRALRDLLRARHAAIELTDAAQALGLSTRSLQRALSAHATSFQIELREARFVRAHELLTTTDDKIASVADAIGLTENALTQLVKERTGCRPTELRRRQR